MSQFLPDPHGDVDGPLSTNLSEQKRETQAAKRVELIYTGLI
jgi:hypothetical protein